MQKPFSILVGDVNAPLVQSKDHQKISESTFKILGEVLNDGGAELSELGIETSQNLSFHEAIKTSAHPTPGTNEFSVNINSLDAEEKYYYRAYAINSEGISYGSIRVLNTHKSENFWWSNLTEQAGGWRTSEWFGSFRPYEHNWLFHADLGWLYTDSEQKNENIWLWHPQKGWLWTGSSIYPHLFQNTSANWLYFLEQKDGIARFYDYTTKSIK